MKPPNHTIMNIISLHSLIYFTHNRIELNHIFKDSCASPPLQIRNSFQIKL